MKVCKLLTISLATTVVAASISTGTAFAASTAETTYYPDNFECSLSFDGGLTDYAVYGDTYAFAYNGQLAVLTGNGKNERLPEIKPISGIEGLDYSADGTLYVCFADGYCVYPDLENKLPLSQITVQAKSNTSVSLQNGAIYMNAKDGSISYFDGDALNTVTASGTFSQLKKYDGCAYAVMNDCLYRLDGTTANKIEPTYYGYIDKTSAIPTGTAAENLKQDGDVKKGWIEKNKYYTEIDIQNPLGSVFEVPDPATATKLSTDRLYCAILAETGNAYIITMGGKCYLTAKTSVSEEASSPTLTAPDITNAYATEKTGIYSRPYISAVTKISELETGSLNAVTVLGQYTDFSGTEFYKISYTKADGTTVSGYVAKAFMTKYSFPAEDEQQHPDGGDEEFKYDTNVVTVVLAIAIVALVIFAVLYVAATVSKKNKSKSAKEKRRKHDRRKRHKTVRSYDDDYDDYYDDEDYD